MREAIEQMNASNGDRLLFLPRMSQAELVPFIKAARLVVLPSLWENLANTCLEAMQPGRPVMGTWGCGFEQVIEDGISGFLVKPGDAANLAERMKEVLADSPLLERVGAGALHKMDYFRIDTIAARLTEYYVRVLSRLHRTSTKSLSK